ncbi:hypothetical protein [Kitasatospora sp. NPDC056731]|uniref:hypothetical protein n=1 Tax=Kitasatospora sp. NPDC056731 TaxID=3155422 RepID=UPI00341D40B6
MTSMAWGAGVVVAEGFGGGDEAGWGQAHDLLGSGVARLQGADLVAVAVARR